MINAKQLRGTGVAVVTPFHEDKSIDFEGLERLITHIVSGGVDYIVALGTTGETATLSAKEQREVATFISEIVDGKIPLVVGAGGNDTISQLMKLKEGYIDSYDALLVATPYYNKPNQEGLYQHFKEIASQATKPIILYNVPGRTACNMTAETTLRLAYEFKNIIAIKEASGDIKQINTICNNSPEHFEVISGDDALTVPLMSIGAIGVISVLANGFPREMTALTKYMLEEKYNDARQLNRKLSLMMEAIFMEGNPSGIKTVLCHKGLIDSCLRLPLVSASDELQQYLQNLLSKI